MGRGRAHGDHPVRQFGPTPRVARRRHRDHRSRRDGVALRRCRTGSRATATRAGNSTRRHPRCDRRIARPHCTTSNERRTIGRDLCAGGRRGHPRDRCHLVDPRRDDSRAHLGHLRSRRPPSVPGIRRVPRRRLFRIPPYVDGPSCLDGRRGRGRGSGGRPLAGQRDSVARASACGCSGVPLHRSTLGRTVRRGGPSSSIALGRGGERTCAAGQSAATGSTVLRPQWKQGQLPGRRLRLGVTRATETRPPRRAPRCHGSRGLGRSATEPARRRVRGTSRRTRAGRRGEHHRRTERSPRSRSDLGSGRPVRHQDIRRTRRRHSQGGVVPTARTPPASRRG